MPMSETQNGHIPDNNLELYALDQLAESKAALLEEHLLVCEECQERLAGWDRYVSAIRSTLQRKQDCADRS